MFHVGEFGLMSLSVLQSPLQRCVVGAPFYKVHPYPEDFSFRCDHRHFPEEAGGSIVLHGVALVDLVSNFEVFVLGCVLFGLFCFSCILVLLESDSRGT